VTTKQEGSAMSLQPFSISPGQQELNAVTAYFADQKITQRLPDSVTYPEKIPPVRLGSFEFSPNPKEANINRSKRLDVIEYPGINGAETQDRGRKAYTISYSGIFYDVNAYEYYRKLVELFNKNEVLTLIDPILGTFSVRISSVSSNIPPRENYVSYSLELMEHVDVAVQAMDEITQKVDDVMSVTGGIVVGKSYTVVAGDCLWTIAQKQLNDHKRWPEIYNLNKAIIGPDPDLIIPGQKLELPE